MGTEVKKLVKVSSSRKLTTYAEKRKRVNKADARYRRQEAKIRRGLEKALARRHIGVRAADFCREAKVENQTFYLHYRNCDEALIQYELDLEEEFVRSLPRGATRDLSFTLLLNFIARYRRYFSAAFQGRNMYLVVRLVQHACSTSAKLDHKSYFLYMWLVGAMILCWGECDRFAERKKEKYRKQLMRLRVMDYGL